MWYTLMLISKSQEGQQTYMYNSAEYSVNIPPYVRMALFQELIQWLFICNVKHTLKATTQIWAKQGH